MSTAGRAALATARRRHTARTLPHGCGRGGHPPARETAHAVGAGRAPGDGEDGGEGRTARTRAVAECAPLPPRPLAPYSHGHKASPLCASLSDLGISVGGHSGTAVGVIGGRSGTAVGWRGRVWGVGCRVGCRVWGVGCRVLRLTIFNS